MSTKSVTEGSYRSPGPQTLEDRAFFGLLVRQLDSIAPDYNDSVHSVRLARGLIACSG